MIWQETDRQSRGEVEVFLDLLQVPSGYWGNSVADSVSLRASPLPDSYQPQWPHGRNSQWIERNLALAPPHPNWICV